MLLKLQRDHFHRCTNKNKNRYRKLTTTTCSVIRVITEMLHHFQLHHTRIINILRSGPILRKKIKKTLLYNFLFSISSHHQFPLLKWKTVWLLMQILISLHFNWFPGLKQPTRSGKFFNYLMHRKRVLCNKLGMFSREIVQKYFAPFLRKIFYCKPLHLPFFYDDEIRLID